MKTLGLRKVLSYPMVLFITIIFSMLASCEKDSFNSDGFNSDFEENSFGLTMIGLGSNETFIRLSGSLFMNSGEIKIDLVDSDGFIVYSRNFFAPGNYYINESFKASRGNWELRYTSLEGRGSIDLHANYRQTFTFIPPIFTFNKKVSTLIINYFLCLIIPGTFAFIIY